MRKKSTNKAKPPEESRRRVPRRPFTQRLHWQTHWHSPQRGPPGTRETRQPKMRTVNIKLAGSLGPYAELDILEGDTIFRLARRACAEFTHWRVNAGQITLHLVAGPGIDVPPPSAEDSARHLEQTDWTLSLAGVAPNAWLLVRSVSTTVRFKLILGSLDAFGEDAARTLSVAVSDQEDLKWLIKSGGGGFLVLKGVDAPVTLVEELSEGGCYFLVGGHHKT